MLVKLNRATSEDGLDFTVLCGEGHVRRVLRGDGARRRVAGRWPVRRSSRCGFPDLAPEALDGKVGSPYVESEPAPDVGADYLDLAQASGVHRGRVG
jgi:hypothetical protein